MIGMGIPMKSPCPRFLNHVGSCRSIVLGDHECHPAQNRHHAQRKDEGRHLELGSTNTVDVSRERTNSSGTANTRIGLNLCMSLQTPAMPPNTTDRSMPPSRMTNVCPMARTPLIDDLAQDNDQIVIFRNLVLPMKEQDY